MPLITWQLTMIEFDGSSDAILGKKRKEFQKKAKLRM